MSFPTDSKKQAGPAAGLWRWFSPELSVEQLASGTVIGAHLGVLIGLVLALLWGGASQLGLLANPQFAAYHALFALRGPLPPPAEVALVAIDEVSLEDLGAMPLPRRLYAEAIEGLLGAGASVVGVDILFLQPAADPEDDRRLADVLRRYPDRVVLAANYQPALQGKDSTMRLNLPLLALRHNAAAAGIVDLPFDVDGGLRWFRRDFADLAPHDPNTITRYEGFDFAIARRHRGLAETWLAGHEGWWINFSGPPGHIARTSFSSLIDASREGNLTAMKAFSGKAVLIGGTALRMQDQYPTPFSALVVGSGAASYMPGVEIHANAVQTLITRKPIARAPLLFEWTLLMLLGLAAGLGFTRLHPLASLTVWISSLVSLGLAAFGLFVALQTWLDVVAPIGLLSSGVVIGVGAQYMLAETNRRLYRRTFERYVAKEIVDVLLERPWLAPKLGGEMREVTVLFSDIRSFTTISETRTPEEVVTFLNAYLTAMAEEIRDERGCIDKYIGDAILALWGNVVPMTPEEAAQHAVRAGLRMLKRLERERPGWEQLGFPFIDIGIGINTGEAVVGNIGSPEKLEFGVIGDAINVASRIEGLTKEWGHLLISGRTKMLLGDGFDCEFRASVKVKGREQPVDIYQVHGEVPGAMRAV